MDLATQVWQWVSDAANWPYIMTALYVADKVVLATPWPQDDFVVGVLVRGIKKLLGRP